MAVITQAIQPGEQRAEVTEIQKALISLNASIDAGEIFTPTTAGTYGPTTRAAIISLLERFGLPHLNPQPFNASIGRLLNIAVGAELGNSAALQQAVRESFDARQAPPVADAFELVWLARYAVMGLEFDTAKKIATLVPNESVIREKVGPIVNWATLQPPPEILNPANYYSVGHDYAAKSTIKAFV
jgi:hypothetical protein